MPYVDLQHGKPPKSNCSQCAQRPPLCGACAASFERQQPVLAAPPSLMSSKLDVTGHCPGYVSPKLACMYRTDNISSRKNDVFEGCGMTADSRKNNYFGGCGKVRDSGK
eukprot:1159890-Pelagomonas_calceolata.AAC.5